MNPETITRLVLGTVLLGISVACGQMTAPTVAASVPTPAPQTITFAINIPDADTARHLEAQYPDGIAMAPIPAQLAYDYTAEYGVANVYFGPLAPNPTSAGGNAFAGTGIVVAPERVANELIFTAGEWPAIAGGLPADTKFTWLGKFVFTPASR